MKVNPTKLPEVLLIEPHVFKDERGFFTELYHARGFISAGIPHHFVQDNLSGSHQGVLRGLHYQVLKPQGKLISAIDGEVFDVAVDIRQSSQTFTQWMGIHLTSENRQSLWIPPGFAHGFYVLSRWAFVEYKVTEYYEPSLERTIRWDDPQLAIDWPLINGENPGLSPKDKQGVPLNEAEIFD